MGKKLIILLMIIFSLALLTGCNETEEDNKNSINYKQFAIDTVINKYNKGDLVIESENYNEEKKAHIFTAYFKDNPGIKFEISTYWYTMNFDSSYVCSDNYEDNYNYKLLMSRLNKLEYKIIDDVEKDYNSTLDKHKIYLEVNQGDDFDLIARDLFNIYKSENWYRGSISIILRGETRESPIYFDKEKTKTLDYFKKAFDPFRG